MDSRPFFRSMGAGYERQPRRGQAQPSTLLFRRSTNKNQVQPSRESEAVIAIADDGPPVREGSLQ